MLISSGVGRILPVVLALAVSTAPLAMAQVIHAPAAIDAQPNLPDAPSFMVSRSSPGAPLTASFNEDPRFALQASNAPAPQAPPRRTRQADQYQLTIAPDEIAPPMSVHDKALGGIRGSVLPLSLSLAAWLTSAGWSHLIDSEPNYGTDSGAFGERLGASALRDTSETIFAVSVFAPIFHEDPRYYQLGRGHSIVRRGVYAATRALVTRTDDGRATPNLSLWAADAAGAALTATYYPRRNRSFGDAFETFSGSVGGSALGFVVTEFLDDALRLAHLKKSE